MFKKTIKEYREQTLLPKEIVNIIKGECEKFYTEKNQKIFTNLVIFDEISSKYEIEKSYKKRVIKFYIEEIEKMKETIFQDFPINEELLNFYLSSLATSKGIFEHNFYHRIFRINDEQKLIVRVNSKFYNVGFWFWEAGMFLCEVIFSHPQMFDYDNVNILELGCGIGITGVFLRWCCTRINYIYLTDYKDIILKNCEKNLKINLNEKERKNIETLNLDWTKEYPEEFFKKLNVKILLAADVIYDPKTVPSLVNLIVKFFSNAELVVFIVVTKRNEETFNLFLKMVEKKEFLKYEELHVVSKNLFEYEERKNVKFFKIWKKKK